MSERKTKALALTFDDGPDEVITPQILDVLEEYKVPASFFLNGKNINSKTSPLIERALKLGCEIENHSYSHHYMDELEKEKIIREIKRNDDKIYKVTHEHTAFFRPPYLALSQLMYDNIDLIFIGGLDCWDWEEEVTADMRVSRTLENACDGAIILLHDFDGNIKTAEAFKRIVPGILEMGYECLTVKELFKHEGVDITSPSCRGRMYHIVKP